METLPVNNGAEALLALNSAAESRIMNTVDVTCQNGPCVGKIRGADFEYYIWKDKAVIGRNSSHGQVDVNIGLSSYVSRKHLQIFRERDRYFLKCLGKNGVFVDGQFQRLGADPLPLKPACTIRFPSTNIKLYFSLVKTENEKPEDTIIKPVEEKPKIPDIPVPAIPEFEETIKLEPAVQDVQTSPISKPFLPIREPTHFIHNPFANKAFLSAPPSPTGTISAANSCPASPRGGTSHMNITDNLKMAAAYAAKVVQERGDSLDGNPGAGNDSPPRDDQKPPYSYAQLIIQAITSSKNKHLTLSGIYAHITKHYPYYRTADKGWQNSIRHNLSLNRYFVKVPRSQEESGKGSFWRIDPASEHKLVDQAWRKRRQRGVPCFRAPLGNISATRSAPASPVHSNPISPQPQPDMNNPPLSISSNIQSLSEQKVQFMQVPRFAQSAPGSPATMSNTVISTGMVIGGNALPVISSLTTVQQKPVINPKPTIPLVSAVGKVIWPMDVTKPHMAFSGGHVMKQVGSNGVVTGDSVIRTSSDPQKLSIVMQQPQQVVMVTGQQPGAQPYPVSLGTIITPTHMSVPQPAVVAQTTAPVLMKRHFPVQQPATSATDEVKRIKLEPEVTTQSVIIKTESSQ